MPLFGKKKEETVPAPPGVVPGEMAPPEGVAGNAIPKETIMNMQQQGLSNNQIIQELQKQGYNSQQIFDSLNAANPSNVPGSPVEPPVAEAAPAPGGMPPPGQAPEMPDQGAMPMPGPGAMPAPGGMPPPMEAAPMGTSADERERIEEMAEAIIDEKWEELVKSINKIIEWKEKIEGNISKIEQEIKDVKESFTNLQSSIIGKINEYDKNIVNVGTEVKAMEKVFEKVLPDLTENVGELKRIVKSSKK